MQRGSPVYNLSSGHPYALPLSYVKRAVCMYDDDICDDMVCNYAAKNNLSTEFPVFYTVEENGIEENITIIFVYGMPSDYKTTISQDFISMAKIVAKAIIKHYNKKTQFTYYSFHFISFFKILRNIYFMS